MIEFAMAMALVGSLVFIVATTIEYSDTVKFLKILKAVRNVPVAEWEITLATMKKPSGETKQTWKKVKIKHDECLCTIRKRSDSSITVMYADNEWSFDGDVDWEYVTIALSPIGYICQYWVARIVFKRADTYVDFHKL